MTRLVAAVLAVAAVIAGSATALPAVTAMPVLYKNCTNLNKKYPHGLGKVGARDRTSGTPVTNFARSTRLYNVAMSYNRSLDRDKDRIACEKG
jgi:Excalibur calcium-binding domain